MYLYKNARLTPSYGRHFHFIVFFLCISIHSWRPFMSELLYLHQTFYDCVSNLQVIERSLILLRFLCIFIHHWWSFLCLEFCIFTKLSQIICLIKAHILIYWYVRCNYKLRRILWFNWVLSKFQCLIVNISGLYIGWW